jgi:hypothetical protein
MLCLKRAIEAERRVKAISYASEQHDVCDGAMSYRYKRSKSDTRRKGRAIDIHRTKDSHFRKDLLSNGIANTQFLLLKDVNATAVVVLLVSNLRKPDSGVDNSTQTNQSQNVAMKSLKIQSNSVSMEQVGEKISQGV